MAKIKIDMDKLCEAYPEAEKLAVLPRKKKKALKKKIANWLMSAMETNAFEIFLQNSIFQKTYESLMEEIKNVSEELNKVESKTIQVSATLKHESVEDLDQLGIDIDTQLENEFAKELIKTKRNVKTKN
jgi:hypothetical protein